MTAPTRADAWPRSAASRTPPVRAPLGRIVCALDGGSSDREAVLRAIALAGSETVLTFLSVGDGRGYSASRGASLTPASARRALDEARWTARGFGVRAQTDLRQAHDAAAAIIAVAADHDLLVLGAGPLVEPIVDRSPVPVLIARAVPDGREFPRDVLVATDATPDDRPVIGLAGALGREYGLRPILLHVGPPRRATRHELAVQATALGEAVGTKPVTWRTDGDPQREIACETGELAASLVVVGAGRVGVGTAVSSPVSVLVRSR